MLSKYIILSLASSALVACVPVAQPYNAGISMSTPIGRFGGFSPSGGFFTPTGAFATPGPFGGRHSDRSGGPFTPGAGGPFGTPPAGFGQPGTPRPSGAQPTPFGRPTP